jgi:hypothetical protein
MRMGAAGEVEVMSDKKRAIAEMHLSSVAEDAPATPQARGFTECPCPKKCPIHGECRLCVAYHGRKGANPRCER